MSAEGSSATRPAARGVARNTAIFSIATGLSRVAGLAREIVASSYFATSGAFSAFTIAFQVPNLLRSLFADSALSAAFVPVFTELLDRGDKRDAFRLASTLFFVITAALGTLTLLFILGAHVFMPVFTGGEFSAELDQLTAGLSQVLFPIVVLLALNGLLVGILNAYDHFAIPAISPLVWNVVILAFLVGTKPFFHGDEQLYAYAIGILAGTIVQLGMAVPVLARLGFKLELSFDWRDPRVLRVFKLMVPVTIGLGIINFDLLLNSTLGSLVSDQAPRAIDAAFRIYMLPQGIFSVAIATVLFPALSRLAAREDFAGLRARLGQGMRLVSLLLIPAAAATIALATPITRLIYQHGAFGPGSTELVSTALFWFSFSLPFSGLNLLLTRTFFSLQQPWLPTTMALGSLVVNLIVSIALYKPFGIAGLVIGTAVAERGDDGAAGPRRPRPARRPAGGPRDRGRGHRHVLGRRRARRGRLDRLGGARRGLRPRPDRAADLGRRRPVARRARLRARRPLAADRRGRPGRRVRGAPAAGPARRPRPPRLIRPDARICPSGPIDRDVRPVPTLQHAVADQSLIRNFSIIAHIDHGKSTLADRILEMTHTVDPRDMRAQVLDSMDLERERGITIKAQAVRVFFPSQDGHTYQLHLIDTPGHVDFTYEVSRSLAACEGALLVVDASQGVEAQTLANTYLAVDSGLELIPCLNKIDLPGAEPERVGEEVAELLGEDADTILRISGKTGDGVTEVLERLVQQRAAAVRRPGRARRAR